MCPSIEQEYPAWNTFIALHDSNLTRLKTMFEELPKPKVPALSPEDKVAAFWASAIDEEAIEAAGAGADVVMLDNYEPALLKDDARTLKEKYPHLTVEASGGITTETMGDYLSEHVDVVSRGNLTQGYACLDYSLKIKR